MGHAQIPSSCSARTLRGYDPDNQTRPPYFIERRRGLFRLTVVYRPRRSNHRTEPSELHRRRKTDHLIKTLFVSDSRMTCRGIRKFGIPQIASDDALDRKVPIMQSERGFEWLFPICETVARKVDPFVLSMFFSDPRNI